LAVDRDCEATLPSQGLTLDAVPGRDRVFLVKSARNRRGRRAELRTVYDDDITDIICDDLRETAERAARALRCELAGVDVITTDVTRPLRESGGFINEVNTTPGLHHHYDSAREAYPKPAVRVLRALLGCGPGGPSRSG
jgi:cyanophycin synthetase